MSTNIFKDIIDGINNENTHFADSGKAAAEYTGSIDTGSYILNALLTGSIWGGVPNNKITAFAGEEATGKTFYLLACVKSFLDKNKDGAVFYFDTEAAVTKEMMSERGIDTSRVIISEPQSIQEFRHLVLQILDNYMQTKEKDRPPMMMCLDSLGQLSTSKELEDTAEGKETRDMTRAQVIKATFRVLTLKLARAKVPLLLTNHVYDNVGGYGPPKVMSGGCFIEGTNIMMPDGSFKAIEEIKEGDIVFTKNGDQSVLETHRFDNEELYEIEFEDRYVVQCTPTHKFLIGGEWVEAKNIIEGMNVEVVYGITKLEKLK